MIYCASLTLHDANGRALETLRYGCMPDDDPKAVTAAMLSDVAALRKRRPELLVGVICDGAREMWNLLDGAVAPAEREGAVRRLVELWHLLGYVGKALRVRHGEGRASSELVRWKLRLLNQQGFVEALRYRHSAFPDAVSRTRMTTFAPRHRSSRRLRASASAP